MALLSTLQDNFNDNSFNTSLWRDNSGGLVSETSGRLQLTASGSNYTLNSQDVFTFDGSYAYCKPTIGTLTSTSYVGLALWDGSAYRVRYFIYGDGTYHCNIDGNISNGTHDTSKPYIKATASGSTVTVSKSADTVSWTSVHSASSSMPASWRAYIAWSGTGVGYVDDFNTLSTYSYPYSGSVTTSLTPGSTYSYEDNDVYTAPTPSLPLALSLSSTYLRQEGYPYAGSLPLSFSIESNTRLNDNYNGKQNLVFTVEGSINIEMDISGDLPLELVPSVVTGRTVNRTMDQTVTITLGTVYNKQNSGWVAETGSLDFELGLSSVTVIRQIVSVDPVVTGGCPQCGTYLYNR